MQLHEIINFLSITKTYKTVRKTLQNNKTIDIDPTDVEWTRPYDHLCVRCLKQQSKYYWISAINQENNDSRRKQQFDYGRFVDWIPQLCEAICDQSTISLHQFIEYFTQEIIENINIEIQEVSRCSTLYWQMTDSVIGSMDACWSRILYDNYTHSVTSIWRIKGFHKSKYEKYIKLSQIHSLKDFVMFNGYLLSTAINYEYTEVDQMQKVGDSLIKFSICGKFIIQHLYCAHAHIKAPLSAMKQLVKAYKKLPDPTQQWWPDVPFNHDLLQNLKPYQLPYCGSGLICKKHHMFQCKKCIQQDKLPIRKKYYQKIEYCCETEYPFYKFYSQYQGFNVRYFNSRVINETLESYYEKCL